MPFTVTAAGASGFTTADAVLRASMDARTAAMGGAGLSEVGVLSMRHNPAGLSSMTRPELTLSRHEMALDVASSHVAFAHPRGYGVEVTQVDYGVIRRTSISSPDGSARGTFGADDLLVRVGYGREFGSRLRGGLSVAGFSMKIDRYSGRGLALDAGIQYSIPKWNGTLALALKNLGGSVRFISGSDPLPLTIAAGIDVRPVKRLKALFELEGVRGHSFLWHTGLEFIPYPGLALRCGFDARNEAGSGFTGGLGVEVRSLGLDYAYGSFGPLGDAHRFSMLWKFGKDEPEESSTAPETPRGAMTGSSSFDTSSAGRGEDPVGRNDDSIEKTVAIKRNAPPDRRDPFAEADVVRRASDRVKVGDYDGAASIIEPLASNADASFEARAWMSTIVYLQGDMPKAIGQLRELLDRWPFYADGWVRLGNALHRTGSRDEALACWRRALEVDAGNAVARLNLVNFGEEQ